MLSALRMVASLCAMTMVVRFSEALSRAFWTMPSACGSSALVASSRSRILGSEMTLRAMAIRCFCPPESRPPLADARVVSLRQVLDEVVREGELRGLLDALHLVFLRCCLPLGADEAVGDVLEHAAVEEHRFLDSLEKCLASLWYALWVSCLLN